MARGIQLAFTLNPREFLRGLKQIEVDLGDVKDALGDVADAGDDALDGLDTKDAERGLEGIADAADEAERALDDISAGDLSRVESEAQDAAREVDRVADEAKDAESAFSRLGRSASADMDKVRRSTDDVEDELGDVETEANQSAKEFGASFRGDPLEALEEVQAYLSEIIAVKMPGFAGAAATAAGGAGVGAILFAYEQWKERQEEIAQRAQDFLGIYREAAGAVNDITDAMVAQQVLEEASAEQNRILAQLAADRGQTLQDFVLSSLKGEVSTGEELAANEQRRRDIADEILGLTEDIRLGNVENLEVAEAQLRALQGEDKYLEDQNNKLRDIGSVLGDNKKSRDLAVDAARAEAAATEAANDAADKLAGKDFGRRALEKATGEADDLDDTVRGVPDIDIKAKVDRSQIDNLPTSKTLNVTARVSVAAATAKAQRLLDQGII